MYCSLVLLFSVLTWFIGFMFIVVDNWLIAFLIARSAKCSLWFMKKSFLYFKQLSRYLKRLKLKDFGCAIITSLLCSTFNHYCSDFIKLFKVFLVILLCLAKDKVVVWLRFLACMNHFQFLFVQIILEVWLIEFRVKIFIIFPFLFLFLSSSSSSGMNDKSPTSGSSIFIISSFFNWITICIDTVWVLQSHFKFFFHISFVVGIVYFFKKTRIRNMSISSLFIIFRCSGMFHLYKSYQKLLV